MKEYLCIVCGYIYKPSENNNIAFEDLDENWVCPLCNAPKSEFKEIL